MHSQSRRKEAQTSPTRQVSTCKGEEVALVKMKRKNLDIQVISQKQALRIESHALPRHCSTLSQGSLSSFSRSRGGQHHCHLQPQNALQGQRCSANTCVLDNPKESENAGDQGTPQGAQCPVSYGEEER